MSYPWYCLIENSDDLMQGDLILECPIVIPPINILENQELEIEIQLINSIILSQSCDLTNGNIDIVLVCPYFELNSFLNSLPNNQASTTKAKNKIIDNLKKGFLPGYHFLNKFEDGLEDYLVVDFRNVYGININSLKAKVLKTEKRLRLNPPYREHLSQAFARYFMRVGLPQDIKIEGY
ncbi:hypothetical protein [Flavobacterium sp.]|uniref:hypothetical protein n=1 Tax=Flavobacterium sp. TaxID=239 RepID=UPI003750894F